MRGAETTKVVDVLLGRRRRAEVAERDAVTDQDRINTVPGEPTLIVILNPARSLRRQCASLLEELSHHLLGHRPTRIYVDKRTGLLQRDYDPSQEAEAYDFGSVLLLPKELIRHHVKDLCGTAQQLADLCGCSVQNVELRIKRCRLWDRYLATCV